MTRIPVLHIITRLANGGAAENTIYTVNGLDRQHWDVHLAIGGTPDDDADQVEKLSIDPDIPVYRIPGLTRNPGPGEFKALRQLRALIRSGGYRIIHTHGAKAGILGRMAGHKEGVPVLINGIHGHTFSPQMNPISRMVYRAIERRVARYTSHFISVGDDLRQQYLAAGVGTPDTFSVIHSGMDLERFIAAGSDTIQTNSAREELGIPQNAVVVANISRMEPRKGHHFFLEAAAHVIHTLTQSSIRPYPNPWFVIVGDGPEEKSLRTQAEQLGIQKRTIFTGYRRDVEQMFAMADIVVLTSLWEGLPRVLVQAAAAGRPVVTFACDGAKEVVHHGVNGYVVPMKDVSAIANSLITLIQDQDLRTKLGSAGRTMVNESWRVETMVEQVEQLYLKLVATSDA